MEWFRWYHGACSDDKWPLIAKKANVPQAFVVAVWAMLLEVASQDEERGSIEEFDPEAADALLDMPDGSAEAILNALSSGKHPRIVDGCIFSWVRRQPKRERDETETSTERVREYRKRQKENRNAILDQCNASETPCNTIETPLKHQETPRTEQRREEKNIKTPPPPLQGGVEGEEDFLASTEQAAGMPPAPQGLRNENDVFREQERVVCMEADPSDIWADEMGIGFLQFLDAYPEGHREPVGEAAAVWKKLSRQKQLPGLPKLFDALNEWGESERWRKENGQYICKAANFLKNKMWLDAPTRASPEDLKPFGYGLPDWK